MEPTPAVYMKGITKSFYGIPANDNISLTVNSGTIHVLLGENGAGKTTLMNVLAGIYRPDAGEVFVYGAKCNIRCPRDAINAGVGMVHQHFHLVQDLTVAENMVLGNRFPRFIVYPHKLAIAMQKAMAEFGLEVNPQARIYDLSVGEQQKVEIAKALLRGAKILILDEPTAVLSPHETRNLFVTLRKMANSGKTIILITHKLKEAVEVADEITILRRGHKVATVPTAETSLAALARLMVGETLLKQPTITKKLDQAEVLMRVQHVETKKELYSVALRDVCFDLLRGEILGVAGVAGNGQRELAEAIVGLKPYQGEIWIQGRTMKGKSPRQIVEEGVAYIPEDRLREGLLPSLGAVDNLLLRTYFRKKFGKSVLLDTRIAHEELSKIIDILHIQISSLDHPVSILSGGNLQRLLLGRELMFDPQVIIACNPTRGLDIAGTNLIHELLLKHANKGAGIVLISEDLDELLDLCDSIVVMFKGRVSPKIMREDFNVDVISALMGGIEVDAKLGENPEGAIREPFAFPG